MSVQVCVCLYMHVCVSVCKYVCVYVYALCVFSSMRVFTHVFPGVQVCVCSVVWGVYVWCVSV